MTIESLLQANLDTHWYAINQHDQLEIIEKDNQPTRFFKTVLSLITCSDFYAHIRYDNILKIVSRTVQHEENRETIDKYTQLIQKIKDRSKTTLSPSEVEKNIVARYNRLAFPETEAVDVPKTSFLQFDAIEAIENCVQKALQGNHPIYYHHSQANHAVFSVGGIDELIFKMQRSTEGTHEVDFSMQERLKNIKKGKSFRKEHKLNLLTIPKAEVIKIHVSNKIRDVLIEKKLDLNGEYKELSEDIKTEMVRQLAIFTLGTGASDMEQRNLPLATSQKLHSKKITVGLIDLEEMNSAYQGLFGGFKREGLVGQFPSKKDIILKEVENKTGISISEISFKKGFEPNFDNFPKSKSKLMEIAHELNKGIALMKALNVEQDEFFVDINSIGPFQKADDLNVDTDKKPWNFPSTTEGDKAYQDASFIGIVSNEFIRLGLISSVSSRDNHGWMLVL